MKTARISTRSAAGLCLVALIVPTALSAAANEKTDDKPDPYQTISKAFRQVKSIDDRAQILADLAWSTEPHDPELSAMARQFLMEYGRDGMPVLRKMIRDAPPRYQADVTATLLEAETMISSGRPEDYLPAMEEAVWFGTLDAKRLGIVEVTRFKYGPALLTIMDAAIEYPELTELVVRSLGQFESDKARHFLLQIVREGTPTNRDLAARALARIGNRAKVSLWDAALDEDLAIRTAAVRILIPVTDPDDLTMLHEFLGRYGDDDELILSLVRSRIGQIEEFLDSIGQPQD